MPIEAAPIIVGPSGNFLGDDGSWSTFLINVGKPPQQLHVLASTEVASTWAVASDGCQQSDASNCTQARGGLYDTTKTSSWIRKDVFGLGAGGSLGYTGNDVNGTYGFDTLGIPGPSGAADTSVENQVVAGLTTKKFFLGSLGLSAQSINWTTAPGDSTPSFLSSLKSQHLIPSLSYGYTAGASYRQGGVNASLTLGGYDTTRFTPNNVDFAFAPNPQRQLVAGLQSVTYTESTTQTPLLSQAILALVDSTVPYLWLPQSACQAFETAFGISWDPIHNLYIVNDTLHDTLIKNSASVIFELSNTLAGGPSVNITLPYASFDLEVDYPLVKSKMRYFPLQRANDDSQYTLGRTFLQEAFILVNYEHSNFSISQSSFDPATPSHIIAVPSTNTTGATLSAATSTTSNVNPNGNGSHSIGTGAIAGIAIAIALIAALGSLGAFCCVRRRRHSKTKSPTGEGSFVKEPYDVEEIKQSDSTSLGDPFHKHATTVTVAAVPMSPPLSEFTGDEYFRPTSPTKASELPAEQVPRSELSTPELWLRPELPSPDAYALSSELSTPEPLYPTSELATHEPRPELPSPSTISTEPLAGSPDISSAESSIPSPVLEEHRHSALSSQAPRLSGQRPTYRRLNTSESEIGFTRGGIRPLHERVDSNESDSSTTSRIRNQCNDRSHLNASVRPALQALAHESAESEGNISCPSSTTRPPIRRSFPVGRPCHPRLDSSDSDSLETRLQMSISDDSPGSSRFGSLRHQRGISEGIVETRQGLLREEEPEKLQSPGENAASS